MMRLEGEQIVVRPLRLDELDAVLATRDGLEIGAQAGRARARGRLIGEVQARGHPAQTLPRGVFEVGIVLYGPADRGKGYGREAVALLTGWLFEQAGAARVQASTAVGNLPMSRSDTNSALNGLYGHQADPWPQHQAAVPGS